MTEITQDGDLIEFHGRDGSGHVAYQARGRAQGSQAVLEFANSAGLRGRVVLQLVQNGAYINGQLQTAMGVIAFDMMRRG